MWSTIGWCTYHSVWAVVIPLQMRRPSFRSRTSLTNVRFSSGRMPCYADALSVSRLPEGHPAAPQPRSPHLPVEQCLQIRGTHDAPTPPYIGPTHHPRGSSANPLSAFFASLSPKVAHNAPHRPRIGGEFYRGGVSEAKKQVCGPKSDLQFRAPLINSFFFLRNNFLMWEGGGVRRRSLAANPPPPPR